MLARYFLLIVGMGLSMGTGCDSRKGAEYRKLESFMEQRIDLSRLYAPEDLAKSTVRMPGPKIVHYLDSSGCVGCKLQSLRMWNVVRGRMRVPVVLVVHVPDMQAIHAQMKMIHFTLPVLYDTLGSFAATYRIDREAYHTFLLNGRNPPRAVGNPIGSDKIWCLYESAIRSDE